MNFENYLQSLKESNPPQILNTYLKALWYESSNDWEKAHQLVQDIENASAAWVHAYLHRKEGDNANAAYWYRRAGKPMPTYSLQKEWEELVNCFLE